MCVFWNKLPSPARTTRKFIPIGGQGGECARLLRNGPSPGGVNDLGNLWVDAKSDLNSVIIGIETSGGIEKFT